MYVEQDCTIEHEGRTFEAGGAVVTDQYAIGYVKDNEDTKYVNVWANRGNITDWHGNFLGGITRSKSFKQWNPSAGYYITMHQITARIDGIYYTGRSQGNGMIWKGKRCAKQ